MKAEARGRKTRTDGSLELGGGVRLSECLADLRRAQVDRECRAALLHGELVQRRLVAAGGQRGGEGRRTDVSTGGNDGRTDRRMPKARLERDILAVIVFVCGKPSSTAA